LARNGLLRNNSSLVGKGLLRTDASRLVVTAALPATNPGECCAQSKLPRSGLLAPQDPAALGFASFGGMSGKRKKHFSLFQVSRDQVWKSACGIFFQRALPSLSIKWTRPVQRVVEQSEKPEDI
jgi:hypothetical protein